MFKKIILKLKWADNLSFNALAKILYTNLIKINKFIIYELDLTQKFAPPILDDGYEIKIIHNKELKQYLPQGKNLSREFSIHIIHGIEYCVVVLKDYEIAHISWIFMNGDRNRWFDLKRDEASLNYSFTFPEFRGKNLFPKAIISSALWLRKRGVRKLLEAPHENTIFTINSFKKIPNFYRIGLLIQWAFYRPKFVARNIEK